MLSCVLRTARNGAGIAIVILLSLQGVNAETLDEIFERGNRAYDAGQYDAAGEAYRTLLRYRVEDPRVEYNLGNTEFRRGNLGLAILHFERALRLDPTDSDITANLDYARSLRIDRVPELQQAALLRWVQSLQDRLGPDFQAWLLLALVWCTACLVAWGVAAPGRLHGGYGWIFAALLVAGALVALSWHTTFRRLEGRPIAVVLSMEAEILAGPGENNATLATVHEGLDVEVRGQRDEWIQVRLPSGVSGWISRDAVGLVS